MPKPQQVADVIPIHSRRDALAWGDAWEAYAHRLEAHNARLQMLLMCAQIHEKASETLREYAERELARVRAE